MNRLPSAQKGSILVWTVVMLAVLIGFAALATDIPYLYVARQQAQTAADAGAIAGAYSLLVAPIPGKAKEHAQAFAEKNKIIRTELAPGQIDTFACNSYGGTIRECPADSADPDQVTCVTHRDVARGNPMPLFLLRVLNLDTADVGATATARRVNACSSNCFKPWSIADRWVDTNGNGRFDLGVDQYDPVTTGYQYPAHNGIQVTLKVGTPSDAIVSGFFYAVDFPPLNRGTPQTGGDIYRENISTCGTDSFVAKNDQLQKEPGNKQGPTRQGVQDLINLDPAAFWDSSCNCANSPKGINSPRLIRIAFFSPVTEVTSGRTGPLPVIKIGGFFIEQLQGNDVVGRFTQVAAYGGAPDPACAGLQTVQLVK